MNIGPNLNIAALEGDGQEWDAYVCSQERASFCHLSGWREVMSDVLGHATGYRMALDERGRICAVLPLVRVKSRVFGNYLVSMPFVNYGGPLGLPAAQVALAADALRQAQRTGTTLLELRTRYALDNGLLTTNARKITVLLLLPESPEALWNEGFHSKLRNKIRRPQREGMEVRFGAGESEPFYEVFSRRMRDLGTPVLPVAFFDRIRSIFGDLVVFGTVYHQERPVAVGCGFVWRDEFEMTWSASLRAYNARRPNMLLYWSFMREMIVRGVTTFNFGRCTPGSGTHEFKRQWGGVDVALPWVQWSSSGLTATPSPERRLYSLGSAVWRHLPSRVANRLGPALARHLP